MSKYISEMAMTFMDWVSEIDADLHLEMCSEGSGNVSNSLEEWQKALSET